MTKQEILDMTGLTEDQFYAQYPTEKSFQKAMGGMVDEYKKGGWIQKATASIKRRGTEGVCTGSKFGGPSCRPGTKRYALAKTFRKMAKARKKEDGGEVEMYAEGGKLPEGILRSRLESHMSPAEAQDYIDNYEQGGYINMYGSGGQLPQDLLKARMRASGASQDEIDSYVDENYGKGGYVVKRSSDRKGKTHVVIGPDGTKKYFGDPKMGERGKSKHGKEAFYARHAKNLKNNPYFRAYARATWADGGMVNAYEQGGVVDVYQLMGMPTPSMYEMGGDVMMEDYARGGMIKRKDGSYSRRGLWDNIRANKGSGKKPTKEMLKQERKIRAAEKKEYGGIVDMYAMGGDTYDTNVYSTSTQRNTNNQSMFENAVADDSGFRQYSKQTTPGSLIQYAGDPNNAQFTANQQYITDPFMKNFMYQRAGYKSNAPLFGMGGTTRIGDLSHIYSKKNHSNMGMAMGGAVNGPNLLQIDTGNMPIFAMGGMTGPITEINVEKGELLTNKDGKIVTEYKGGGMVPHPEEGIDERGTVPAQEGMFVITKAMAKKYKAAMKNNDKLYADAIRNNIAFDKARKEAAEEQAAMTAYDKFTAKYGGAIRRMYAKGGNIPKYNNGGLNLNNPAFNNNNFSFTNPNSSFSGSMDFLGTPNSLNLDYSPMTMGQYRTGQTGSYMDYRNIPDTGIGYKGTDTPPSDPNKPNYQDFMSQAIPYGVAASQVIEPLLQRPFKMKSQDYETPADLKWRELTGETGRRDLERARAGMQYTARNIGGSNALAALTGGANEYYRNLAAYNEALENKNRMGQSEIDRANKAIQQANLSQRMQMAMFNEQNRAARRNAIRQGVMNVAGTYYNQQANQMTKQALSAGYPDYQFPWNKKKSS